jgi:hypothetical protein
MRSAARVGGVTVDDTSGAAALKVDLKPLGEVDPDLFDEIITYRDETESGLVTGPISPTTDDHADEPSASETDSVTMDQLANARTDGGK